MIRKEPDIIRLYRLKDKEHGMENPFQISNIKREIQKKMIPRIMMKDLRNHLNQKSCSIWHKKTQ